MSENVSLRKRLGALVPALRQRADAAEQARRVPNVSVEELTAAGLFRAFVPRRHGGDELPITEVLEGVIELAHGCTSTAWVGSLLSFHGLLAAWFDPRAQAELWAGGPDVRIASSVAPAGSALITGDGFRLSGRWSFCSGIDHSTWVMLGGLPTTAEHLANPRRDPTTVATQFLVPLSACTIEDDWDVAGLRATGSKSVTLRDVEVPAHRALPLVATEPTAGQRANPQPLYQVPWQPIFNSAFPPVALGTALANLAAFRDHIGARVNAFTGRAARTAVGPSLRLAEATARIDAALAMFQRDGRELTDAGTAPARPLSPAAQARIVYNAAFVIDQCSEAINQLWRGSGGRALHRGNAMQRHFRDIYAMTQHGAFDMDACGERYGKELLSNPTFGVAR